MAYRLLAIRLLSYTLEYFIILSYLYSGQSGLYYYICLFFCCCLFLLTVQIQWVRASQKHVTVRVNIQQQPIFSFNTVIIWIKIFKCERGLQGTVCRHYVYKSFGPIITCEIHNQWVTPWTPNWQRQWATILLICSWTLFTL